MEKPLTITLVHGTWARNAKWTKPDSPLPKALRDNLGNIEIEALSWSSRNRFSARNNARSDLANRIRDKSGFHHFIIAHSHGGNVAREAVRGQEELVAGVVCLNTPFFTALNRETNFIFDMVVAYVGLTFIWTVWAALVSYEMHWLAALGVSLAIFALLMIPIEKTRGWAERRGEFLRKKLSPSALRKTRFLCFTTPEDEVFGWLTFFEGLANLPFLLMSAWILPIVWVLVLALLATGALPTLSAPWELWSSTVRATTQGWQGWLFFFLSSWYLSGILFVASALLAGLLSLILVAIPYGTWVFPDANLFLRVLITLTPVSSGLAEFQERKARGEGLKHSLLYEDKETIELIVDWIRSVAASSERDAQDVAAGDAPQAARP